MWEIVIHSCTDFMESKLTCVQQYLIENMQYNETSKSAIDTAAM